MEGLFVSFSLSTLLFLMNICPTVPQEIVKEKDVTIPKESNPIDVLNGHWIEDQYQRKNLNNYLYEMGMGWIKRVYATSTSWEDELKINVENGWLHVNGLRGPFAEPYEFHGRIDNQTLAEMDIGAFGGKTFATVARSRDNSIINYVRKPDSANLFFTVTDTIHPKDVNVLIVKYRHVDTNVVWTSIFNRNIEKSEPNVDYEEDYYI